MKDFFLPSDLLPSFQRQGAKIDADLQGWARSVYDEDSTRDAEQEKVRRVFRNVVYLIQAQRSQVERQIEIQTGRRSDATAMGYRQVATDAEQQLKALYEVAAELDELDDAAFSVASGRSHPLQRAIDAARQENQRNRISYAELRIRCLCSAMDKVAGRHGMTSGSDKNRLIQKAYSELVVPDYGGSPPSNWKAAEMREAQGVRGETHAALEEALSREAENWQAGEMERMFMFTFARLHSLDAMKRYWQLYSAGSYPP